MGSGIRTTFGLNGVAGDAGTATAKRLRVEADAAERSMALAHTGAMKDVLNKNVGVLRADIAAGGFYNGVKLSKTWQGRVYPNGAFSIEPAAFIFNRASTILDAFTLGVTITVLNRQFLAVPVGPAKAIVRRMNQASNRSRDDDGKFVQEADTVERVAAALGVPKLEAYIDRRLGSGVLVAPGQKINDRLRRMKRGDDTVLFVLTRAATLKRRIQGRALLTKFDADFEADFESGISRHLAPEDR
jgi:hypothetical protein